MILIVDDEQRMLDLIELFLVPAGFSCLKETSGKKAIDVVKREVVDLVLLDVMMPEMDGWEVCAEIRKFSSVPIIMLTARSDKADVAKGLNIGADDYITKPFNDEELIARVKALLRRTIYSGSLHVDHFVLDKEAYSLRYGESVVQLTLKEFLIVDSLISRPQKIFTREELMNAAWEFDTYTDIRTVDSHIRNLREKLKKAGFPTDSFIKTVWGIGYKWN